MNKKTGFYIYGALLCALGIAFLIFALSHPEMSFPWPNWVTYIIYGLYVIYTVFIFVLPKLKDSDLFSCIILTMQFIALTLLAVSIGTRNSPDESNWYLPAALGTSCFANFALAIRKRKKNKK